MCYYKVAPHENCVPRPQVLSSSSYGLKIMYEAQTSISVPSTLTCPSDNNLWRVSMMDTDANSRDIIYAEVPLIVLLRLVHLLIGCLFLGRTWRMDNAGVLNGTLGNAQTKHLWVLIHGLAQELVQIGAFPADVGSGVSCSRPAPAPGGPA